SSPATGHPLTATALDHGMEQGEAYERMKSPPGAKRPVGGVTKGSPSRQHGGNRSLLGCQSVPLGTARRVAPGGTHREPRPLSTDRWRGFSRCLSGRRQPAVDLVGELLDVLGELLRELGEPRVLLQEVHQLRRLLLSQDLSLDARLGQVLAVLGV